MELLRSLVCNLYNTGVIINRCEEEIWKLFVQTFLTNFNRKPPAACPMTDNLFFCALGVGMIEIGGTVHYNIFCQCPYI